MKGHLLGLPLQALDCVFLKMRKKRVIVDCAMLAEWCNIAVYYKHSSNKWSHIGCFNQGNSYRS